MCPGPTKCIIGCCRNGIQRGRHQHQGTSVHHGPISDIFTELGVPVDILLQPEVPASGSHSAGLHPAQPPRHTVYAATVVPDYQAVGPAAMQHCYHQRLCQALGLRLTGKATGDDGVGGGSAAADPTDIAASADAGPGLLSYSDGGKQGLQ